ncbi:MAG: Cadherin-like beta sandwich domain protein [Mucilaginibacter sp.]|nr:Cadherin-like beta sandwich domain protein [Mucilaginibacter sp.]
MKTRILFCLVVCAMVLCAKSTIAATYDWTGATSTNWSTPGNWIIGSTTATTAPGSTDNVQIGVVAYTGSQPTVNANSTCATLTIGGGLTNVTLTIGDFTLTVSGALTVASGTNSINGTTSSKLLPNNILVTNGTVNFGGGLSVTVTMTTIVGNGTTTPTVTLNSSVTLNLTGNLIINSGSTFSTAAAITLGLPSTGTSLTNGGTLTFSGGSINVGKKASLINNGTITSTSTTFNLFGTGNPALVGITNNGTFTATTSTFTLSGPNSFIKNIGGTFTDNNSAFTLTGANSKIVDSLSTAVMHLRGSTIIASGNPLALNICINNSGTFTADLASKITIGGTPLSITNSGTFNAGTSNSACTITLNGSSAAITNTGTFNLGSTSAINPTGVMSSIANNSGTFTLQSDANGSASIGALGTGATCTGTFTVQRYLSGGQTNSRGYRVLSSPVYTNTSSAANGSNNIYSINYVQSSALVTGLGGAANGFDASPLNSPTLYFYRDDVASNGNSFIGGNFRGLTDIRFPPSYSVNIDGSGFNLPVGNGFFFFDRGDRTTNFALKYLSYTIAEPITLTTTGTLNTGSITVHPWFNPTSSNLDYTSVPGNSNVIGFALVGNPYACSIDWNQYSTSTGTGIYAPSVGPFIWVLDAITKNYVSYGNGLGSGSNVIPSGQGFFVQATGALPQLVFNETAKIPLSQATQANGNFYLGKPVQAAVMQYLNLKLIKDDVNKDGTLICFKSGAKQTFDANEDAAYKPGNGVLSLSTISSDNFALAINTLPLPDQTLLIIPLKVSGYTDGTYKLYLAAIKSIPDLYDIWLMDTYKKDSVDIKHNPVYSFNITNSVPATYGSGRFSLVIRQNPAKGVHLLSFTASKISGGSQITWKTENEQNYTYFTVERSTNGGTTFDVLGSVTSSALGTYSFLDKAPVKGSNKYHLKIEDLNGTITYSQVVSLDYLTPGNSNISNIIIYPNPVSNTINLSITQNSNLSPKLSYSIKVSNITGTVVKNGNTKTAAWQENASNLTPGTYVLQVINNNDNSLVGKATFIKL